MVEVVQEASTWQVITAMATVAAVVVALFGPALRSWWRRPRIKLQAGSAGATGMWLGGQTADSGPLVFVDVNNAGRQQANSVQVFISITQEVDSDFGKAQVSAYDTLQTPIPFIHREGGRWTRQFSVSIPWGFSRPLQLLEQFEDGSVRIAHGQGGIAHVLGGLRNGNHMVTLDVLGSNFKVCRFFGVLKLRGVGEDEARMDASWQIEPAAVRYQPAPFPKHLRRRARRAS